MAPSIAAEHQPSLLNALKVTGKEIGSFKRVAQRIERFGLPLQEGSDHDVVNVENVAAERSSGGSTTR